MQWNNTLLDQNSSLHTNYVGRSVCKKTVVRNRVNSCTIVYPIHSLRHVYIGLIFEISQFILIAHAMGLVEIISDEGLLQLYGEVHNNKFHAYANENVLFELPDSTIKNCSILSVRIYPG